MDRSKPLTSNIIDNNTIILRANTSREGMYNEPCTYGITIIDYYYTGGTAYASGHAANHRITNNNITCTAYNMYGIEEFGGSDNLIENNTFVATGDTAMAIGVIGLNIVINNNNLTVNGTSFSGSTVDYLGARTTGIYIGRGYNTTATNNNINSTYAGIYTEAQDTATITDNNITTDYTHTILLDSTTQHVTVENNYLITPENVGDESVNNKGNDNTVQNNQPVNENNYLTNDNYNTYFDENTHRIKPEYNGKTIIATEIITNPVIIGSNTILTSQPEGGYTQITLSGAYNSKIENTTANIINIESSSNSIINNVTMTADDSLIKGVDSYEITVENNSITTKRGYAITFDAQSEENTIRYNELITPYNTGDLAVSAFNAFVSDNYPKSKANAMITPIYGQPVTKEMEIGENWTMGATFYGPNWEDLAGRQIDILIDGEIVETTTPRAPINEVYYTYTATTAGVHNITMNLVDEEFKGNYTFTATVNEAKTYSLKVDTTEFTIGSNATITASIYYGQEIATNISKGKVSFKVNGKTLKDANGKVIYAKVVNGTATIEDFEVPESWAEEGTTIQALYSGSGNLAKMTSQKTEITISITEPTITTEDITASAGNTITLTATINSPNTINSGKVVFKINGKTLKDASSKVIYTKVVNSQVSVTYTLPEDMNAKDYNLTAVFISPDYERLEDTKTLTVES